MVRVRDFCIDRYEMATVDAASGEALSPYYPPEPRLLASVYQSWSLERGNVGVRAAREQPLPELPAIERTRSDFTARAVSRAGMIPQAYLSQPLARAACERAGKRLCSEAEWVTACKGERAQKFPYGPEFDANACNVYRHVHPAATLHNASFYGHRDPRLNLVDEPGKGPLLRPTGATASCVSTWHGEHVYDMVGNLDEWVEDSAGLFLGGFYARSTREGCESRISAHAPPYYDYSTGARCCRALDGH
jgi:sulfatase modifying factor 1